ncbi:MAG: 4-hydroxy-tetrahydrodipicolinate synthase [Lachnoanaerobaculum gingivalis]|jgi:dihydrodipicolinate synthase
MAIFEGAGVALITPMNEDGSVNYNKLEEILEEQIADGTDCIIACGTTGEASTLTVEEHLDVIKRTIEIVNKRIPVIAGTGSNSTETAVEFSKEAQEYGADGVLVVSPYYNKATQKGLIQHFSAIANAIDIPVVLYNIPGRTGVNIEPETIAYLVNNVPNIVGVKEASGNFSNAVKTLRLCPEIDMYSGNDDQVVPLMSIGAKGVISVLSNVAPRQTHDMCQAALDGDFVKARKMQIEALDVVENLFTEVNPIPVKAAMNLQGKNVGPLRLPLTQMEKAHEDALAKAMKEYGIL